MPQRQQRFISSYKNLHKAKINHAILVLLFLALYSFFNAFQIYKAAEETLYPKEIIYQQAAIWLFLSIPFFVSLFSKKIAFVIGIFLSILLIVRGIIVGNYFGIILILYTLAALTVGLIALLKSERLNKEKITEADILDSNIF